MGRAVRPAGSGAGPDAPVPNRSTGFVERHTSTTLPLMLSGVALVLSVVAILTQGAAREPGGAVAAATEWTEVPAATLASNGWQNLSPDRASTVAYYRDAANIVHLKGQARILFETIPAESTLFVLPTGFRPRREVLLGTYLNGVMGRISILPVGNVVVHVPSQEVTLLSLDGLSFQIEG